MKKIMLLLCLFVSSIIYSQTTIYTSASRMGTWDAVTESYNYTEWKSSNIIFKSTSAGIYADDYAKSYYIFTSPRGVDKGVASDNTKYTSYYWECLDESNKKCTLIITVYSDLIGKVSVIYNSLGIVFNYKFTVDKYNK